MARRRGWWFRWTAAAVCAAGAFAGSGGAGAEDATAPPLPPAPAPATAPQKLTRAQLKELVGPVAMYPDGVLASLLPATTFPLDVIAAARWLESKGGVVDAVPEDRGWDASVLALLQFPDVLRWLNDNLAWMDQMGRAVAVQQAEVLQAIQDFRREAQAAGNLPPADKLVVKEEPAQGAPSGTTVIVVEPASPQVVYLPAYDPYVVCCGPSLGVSLYTFGLGFGFGALGFWGWHDIYWGWWDYPHHWGWYGGIYYHHAPYYWGHPHAYDWYTGPYRPRHWTSRYYPPRADGSHVISRPTGFKSAFPRTTTGTTRTTTVRPPDRVRIDAGVRSPPSPVSPTRAAPTWRRTSGTLPGSTYTVPKSTFRAPSTTTRRAWTERTFTRPSKVTSAGIDPDALRGKTSLGTARRTFTGTGLGTRTYRAPTTRTLPSISQPRLYRSSSASTRSWSTRGHGSLQRSAPRGASGRSFHR